VVRAGAGQEHSAFAARLASDLLAHRGAGAILVGPRQSPFAHALAAALNAALGNSGAVISYLELADPDRPSHLAAIRELSRRMAEGSVQTLLILAGSLIGVQLGALGTTYVKDYMIKLVMASTMLIVAVSRGAKIPGYLADLNLAPALEPQLAHTLSQVSYWALVTALASAALIITVAMVKGMTQAKAEAKLKEVVSHG